MPHCHLSSLSPYCNFLTVAGMVLQKLVPVYLHNVREEMDILICFSHIKEAAANIVALRSDPMMDHQTIPFLCKQERSEDGVVDCGPELEMMSLFHNKKLKLEEPNTNGNGSEDSTMSQDRITSSALVEFPLLQSFEAKESQPSSSQPSFDAATLEKSVPPGYLKFINNLESEILNVSMEKETLKIEVMRAQAMIDILQSQINNLTKENADLKRGK
ncbi:hypothetical protein Tco_0831150 [Tanacetum coccineum]